MVVFDKDTPHHSFIDTDPERLVDLLRDPRTSVAWISVLHFNDGMNEFCGWSLWNWLDLIYAMNTATDIYPLSVIRGNAAVLMV
jgi:hypothetical protein